MEVTTRGAVSSEEVDRASSVLAGLDRYVPDPVFGARVMLRWEPNPRLERPARAEAELDVNGRLVCSRVAAAAMPQAIGELAERLERQLRDFGDRRERMRRRLSHPEDGAWQHGESRASRLPYFPRPVAERELIRRKTFALEPLDPLQAVDEMLDLDHDFYLFRDAGSGADAVVHRREDGHIGLLGDLGGEARELEREGLVYERSWHSEPLALPAAISEMDELSHRFMFFVDAHTGRGNVIYMRYDGNYGLIEPAA